mmetsp:Transcript_481/g.495  ORF Transcript_481/g.495 Transcript_481/m.495 type:complete len:138 (+) Transcript_481:86-499(+)
MMKRDAAARRRSPMLLALLPFVAAVAASGFAFAPLRCPQVSAGGRLCNGRAAGRTRQQRPPMVVRQISKLDALGFKRHQSVAILAQAPRGSLRGTWHHDETRCCSEAAIAYAVGPVAVCRGSGRVRFCFRPLAGKRV